MFSFLEHNCDSKIDSEEFTCSGKTLISDDNMYNGYTTGCTGPHEDWYSPKHKILEDVTGWIMIKLKEPHYISKVKFEPNFRPSRQEVRHLSIEFPDGHNRTFEVGKNFGEVGSASIDIRKPLKWTNRIDISGITSKTFVDNQSRFGYKRIDLFECVGNYYLYFFIVYTTL